MMHLELQPGLTPDEFCKQARRFVDWFIELVERHMFYERRGWTAHLEAYDWKGRGWRETLRFREGWQEGLASNDRQAVEGLLEWGHMDDLDPEATNTLLASRVALDEIDAGRWEHIKRIPPNRIASISKVYSTAAMDSWSIYDSRVGHALAYAVDCWCRHTGEQGEAEILSLRVPRGRESATNSYVRQPPEAFSTLNERAPMQARLSFIYSSWLIRCIALRLSKRLDPPVGSDRWRPVYVEMALFMLGYDTRKLSSD